MLSELKKFIAAKNLFTADDKILLAVSGGIDSMVMADLFLGMPNKWGIAHCNFALRGSESDGDELFVREYAGHHNLPFYAVRFETKSYAAEKGISIQMAARELRYSWFEEVRKSEGYDFVAIAHNLNDNIETLLINLARGTGLTGLSGMKPASDRIVRPLLFATRESIQLYCDKNSVRFREDRSNSDTKYIRNKIRHRIIPVLKEINPSIEITMNDTSSRLGEINDIVIRYISELSSRVFKKADGLVRADIGILKEHTINRSILYELFRNYGVTGSQTGDLINIIEGSTGGMIHTGKYRIIRNRDEILISEEKKKCEAPVIVNDISGLCNHPLIISAVKTILKQPFSFDPDPSFAYIDLGKIEFPLTLRKWEAGDSFHPLGMKKRKKLSDYFIDRKYSIPEKEEKYVLESAGNIVWIVGDRLDDRFRITSDTTEALVITSGKTQTQGITSEIP